MVARSLADDEGVLKTSASSSSLSSKRLRGSGVHGDEGRVTIAGDVDVPTVGSVNFDREGTGNLEQPVTTKSKSRSSSLLSARSQGTGAHGDEGRVTLTGDVDIPTVGSADFDRDGTGNLEQPVTTISDSRSRGTISPAVSGDFHVHTTGSPDLAKEATGAPQHLVKKRSKSRSSSRLSSRSRETISPDESVSVSGDADGHAVDVPSFSEESTGHRQYTSKRRSNSRSVSSYLSGGSGIPQSDDPGADAAVSLGILTNPAEDHITLQFDQADRSELQVPKAVLLRPETVPLSSLPALEAIRSLQGGSSPLRHSPGSHRARRDSESDKRSGSVSVRSGGSGSYSGYSRVSYASSSTPALHGAWIKRNRLGWRHIVTGAIYYNDREPEHAGPSADDIPDGWTASLARSTEEIFEYEHSATNIVIEVPPKSLPEDVIKQFEVAASYGGLPEHCRAELEDDCINYYINNESDACPRTWHSSKHPKVVEDEIKAYLADLKVDYTRRPEVTLLTSGQELPVDVRTADLSKMSGILKVTDIDKPLIAQLVAAFPEATLLSFFIVCYFLLRTSHEDEATKELAQQIQGWYWMTHRGTFNDRYWVGKHYDLIHDDDRDKLHFGYAQCLTMRRNKADVDTVVRLSIFEFSTELALVLIGTVKPDWDDIQAVAPTGGTFSQPTWWLPAVPAYLGFGNGAHRDADVRRYLTRLLRAVTVHLDDHGLPRMDDVDTKWNFEEVPELLIAFRLVMSTWEDGVLYLTREMDYFWEQAIKGPHVNDFARLKTSKQYAETLYQDLGAWIMLMEGLLTPDQDQSGRRAMGELKDTLGQISSFKQEIGDTFQLLIGAIAIKDSEIQKKLAQESKLQARRSTALTALAAIYLPLSLTTGIFGMNVIEIQEGRPRWWSALAVAVGFMVATLPFLVWVYLDKDDQGQKPVLSTALGRRSVESQRHQLGNNNGTLSKTHSQDFDPKPLGIVRRRTTRYSQMDWAVTGASRPGSPRKKLHPEHMV